MDSTALSKLCISLPEQDERRPKPQFHAFVVNHKARPGSLEEAQLVSSGLQRFGNRCSLAFDII